MSATSLHLPGVDVLDETSRPQDSRRPGLTIHARALPVPCPAPRCRGCHRAGTTTITIVDLPIGTTSVRYEIEVQRRRNPVTGQVTTLRPHTVHPTCSFTWRALMFIAQHLGLTPMSVVASWLGVSESTVRTHAQSLLGAAEADYEPSAPEVVLIDDCHALRRAQVVASDGETGAILAIVEGTSTEAVHALLDALGDLSAIQVVATDMSDAIRNAIRARLPWARHVADRYHVTRLWTRALDSLALEISRSVSAARNTPAYRQQWRFDRSLMRMPRGALTADQRHHLDLVLSQSEILAEAYAVLQTIRAMYACRQSQDARDLYGTLCAGLSPAVRAVFAGPITEMAGWETEVFAFFDRRYTTGRAEANNRRLKSLAKRFSLGRDDFNLYRRLVLARFGPPAFKEALLAAVRPPEPEPAPVAESDGSHANIQPCRAPRNRKRVVGSKAQRRA